MTLQQLFESLVQHDPTLSFTEATLMLNNTLRNFVNRSRLLESFDTSITTTASTDGYTIPSGMFMVRHVKVGDDDAIRLIGNYTIGDNAGNHQKYFWQVEDGNIRITYDDGNFSYPDASLSVTVVGYIYDTAMSSISDSPSIPGEYHEALLYDVLSKLYMRPHIKDINTSAVYAGEYKKQLSDAKRYARSRKHTLGAPAPVYY